MTTFKIGNWTDEPCWYVSIVDGTKHALLLGPFRTESACRQWAYLDAVDGGSRSKHLAMIHKAGELDPKSAFYGFGMCKVETGHREGVMNKHMEISGSEYYGLEPYSSALAEQAVSDGN